MSSVWAARESVAREGVCRASLGIAAAALAICGAWVSVKATGRI